MGSGWLDAATASFAHRLKYGSRAKRWWIDSRDRDFETKNRELLWLRKFRMHPDYLFQSVD
jgi:hypothetical protein